MSYREGRFWQPDVTVATVVVRDGRIIFAGPEWAAPEDKTGLTEIDLQGAAMFPGFTDGHAHLDGIGWREMTLNLEGSASVVEAMQRLNDWARAHPEGVIVGRGWIETHWPEKRFPTRTDLDAVSTTRPIVLGRSDGHATVLNTAALKLAGAAA